MSASSKPIPIALPNELLGEIDFIAEKLNLTRSELMRLSMRIGLAEIGAVAEPLTQTVARETERLGITFADWIRSTRQAATHKEDYNHRVKVHPQPAEESKGPTKPVGIKAGTVVTSHAKDRHITINLNEEPTPYVTDPPQEPLTGHYKGYQRPGEINKKLASVLKPFFTTATTKKPKGPDR